MGLSKTSFLMLTLSALLIISCYGQTPGSVVISSRNVGFDILVPSPLGLYVQFSFYGELAYNAYVADPTYTNRSSIINKYGGGTLIGITPADSWEGSIRVGADFTAALSQVRSFGYSKIQVSTTYRQKQKSKVILYWTTLGNKTSISYNPRTIKPDFLSTTFKKNGFELGQTTNPIAFLSNQIEKNSYNFIMDSTYDFYCQVPDSCRINVLYTQKYSTHDGTFSIELKEHTQKCGNKITESIFDVYKQTCDPPSDGCSQLCQINDGFKCSGSPSKCWKCGDGVIDSDEQCDPPSSQCSSTCQFLQAECGNSVLRIDKQEECDPPGRGCLSTCKIDTANGYKCSGSPSVCWKCGDNKVDSDETCDPPGAGCLATCQIDTDNGYKCAGTTSVCWKCGDNKVDSDEQCDPPSGQCSSSCKLIPKKCGDGYRGQDEQCDNGGLDGCKNCKVEVGFTCFGGFALKSNCQPICGDGIMVGYEKCDNGKKVGCLTCLKPDQGYTCKVANKLVTYSTCKKV